MEKRSRDTFKLLLLEFCIWLGWQGKYYHQRQDKYLIELVTVDQLGLCLLYMGGSKVLKEINLLLLLPEAPTLSQHSTPTCLTACPSTCLAQPPDASHRCLTHSLGHLTPPGQNYTGLRGQQTIYNAAAQP